MKQLLKHSLRLEAAGLILLIAALGLGACNAFLRFPDQFDFITYHLPSSLQFFNLTTYWPDEFHRTLIAGHPPVAHWVTGAMIAASGHISAATFLGTLAFTGFAAGFYFLTRDWRQTFWLMLAGLAVPLVAMHLYAPYVDLWMGAWLALALFAAVRSVNHGLTRREAVVFCLAVGLGAGTKFQALPGACILWLWTAFHWFRASFIRRTVSRRLVLVTLTLSAAFIAAWPVRNWIVLGNPTYPWQTPFIGRFINDPALVRPVIGPGERVIPDNLVNVPQPLRFVYSVFEAGRLKTPSVTYTHDMWNDSNATDNVHHRAGGWGIWTVLLLVLWAGHWLRRREPAALRTAVLFIALATVISCLNRSPELRYWLFLPLGAIACLVHYDSRFLAGGSTLILLCFGLTMHSVWPVVRYPGKTSVYEAAPPEARAFWKVASPGVAYSPPVHDFKTYWAGPDFNTFTIRSDGKPAAAITPPPAANP